MEDTVNDIGKKCLECGLCSKCCQLLAEVGRSPKLLAAQGVTATEAFSCTLCGGCEAACPEGLSPKGLFAEGRRQAVNAGECCLDEYRYLFPDRENSLMNVYRRFSGIDYSDIELKGEADSAFFPGCTLLTYAPDLTREVYARLRDGCGSIGLMSDCCGKPLSQLGLPQRADKATRKLVARIKEHNVRELITACPGCYYELQPILKAAGVRLRTVYEVLAVAVPAANGKLCTVHDSCPDRFDGIFGRQVRELLQKSGFPLGEMAHSQKNTICCGSGGMISHFRPDLTEELVGQRLAEARSVGAEVLVSYCVSCVSKFAAAADGLVVDHALSLLLGRRVNYTEAKKNMARMLEGPQGAEIWAKIMAD